MKNIFTIAFFVLLCMGCKEDNDSVNPTMETGKATSMENATSSNRYIPNSSGIAPFSFSLDKLQNCECERTPNYIVSLSTLNGIPISPSQVQPSTEYNMNVTLMQPYTPCLNPAYLFVANLGFTHPASGTTGFDSVNGSRIVRILTNPTLPPFGILGVIEPYYCGGQQDENYWGQIL